MIRWHFVPFLAVCVLGISLHRNLGESLFIEHDSSGNFHKIETVKMSLCVCVCLDQTFFYLFLSREPKRQ